MASPIQLSSLLTINRWLHTRCNNKILLLASASFHQQPPLMPPSRWSLGIKLFLTWTNMDPSKGRTHSQRIFSSMRTTNWPVVSLLLSLSTSFPPCAGPAPYWCCLALLTSYLWPSLPFTSSLHTFFSAYRPPCLSAILYVQWFQ